MIGLLQFPLINQAFSQIILKYLGFIRQLRFEFRILRKNHTKRQPRLCHQAGKNQLPENFPQPIHRQQPWGIYYHHKRLLKTFFFIILRPFNSHIVHQLFIFIILETGLSK